MSPAPCWGCPGDLGGSSSPGAPAIHPLPGPGCNEGWKRAGSKRHLGGQRVAPAGSLPLWKGMWRAGSGGVSFPSALGRWQGAGLGGEERAPAAKFPREARGAGPGWPRAMENEPGGGRCAAGIEGRERCPRGLAGQVPAPAGDLPPPGKRRLRKEARRRQEKSPLIPGLCERRLWAVHQLGSSASPPRLVAASQLPGGSSGARTCREGSSC